MIPADVPYVCAAVVIRARRSLLPRRAPAVSMAAPSSRQRLGHSQSPHPLENHQEQLPLVVLDSLPPRGETSPVCLPAQSAELHAGRSLACAALATTLQLPAGPLGWLSYPSLPLFVISSTDLLAASRTG